MFIWTLETAQTVVQIISSSRRWVFTWVNLLLEGISNNFSNYAAVDEVKTLKQLPVIIFYYFRIEIFFELYIKTIHVYVYPFSTDMCVYSQNWEIGAMIDYIFLIIIPIIATASFKTSWQTANVCIYIADTCE